MSSVALPAPRARLVVPKASRPPVALTERRLSLICEKIANGVPMTTAAIAAGVPRRTFQVWLARGREEGSAEPYRSMADRIETALALYHESRVDLVHEGAVRDPRLAQWELERRFKDDWGDPRRGDLGVTVNVGVLVESPEWLALRDRALEALARHPAALADYLAAIGGGEIADGEVVGEIAP